MAGELHTDLELDTDAKYLITEADEAASPAAARRSWGWAAGAIGLLVASGVAGTVLAASTARGAAGAGRRGTPHSYTAFRPDGVQEKVDTPARTPLHPDVDCYTVSWRDAHRQWADCYEHTLWAKHIGVVQHPDWYVQPYTLDVDSPFEMFQYYIYHNRFHNWVCPQPCPTGTVHIYYKNLSMMDPVLPSTIHPSMDLKYGECTFDGQTGANMLVGNFNPWNHVNDRNYYAYVHHFDNVFCEGTPNPSWFVYTDGDTSYSCCAANGTMCSAACSAR